MVVWCGVGGGGKDNSQREGIVAKTTCHSFKGPCLGSQHAAHDMAWNSRSGGPDASGLFGTHTHVHTHTQTQVPTYN